MILSTFSLVHPRGIKKISIQNKQKIILKHYSEQNPIYNEIKNIFQNFENYKMLTRKTSLVKKFWKPKCFTAQLPAICAGFPGTSSVSPLASEVFGRVWLCNPEKISRIVMPEEQSTEETGYD